MREFTPTTDAELIAQLQADSRVLIVQRLEAIRERDRLIEALTPSGDTKAAYIGEFKMQVVSRVDSQGYPHYENVTVPWTTIKEIMKAIRDRAAQPLNELEEK